METTNTETQKHAEGAKPGLARADGSLLNTNLFIVCAFSAWAVGFSAFENYPACALSLLLAALTIHLQTAEDIMRDAIELATECNDGWKEAIEHSKHLARLIEDRRKANEPGEPRHE